MLVYLAKTPIIELFSTDTMLNLKLTPSSSKKAAEALLEKDLVYISKDKEYKILNPAIGYNLRDQ